MSALASPERELALRESAEAKAGLIADGHGPLWHRLGTAEAREPCFAGHSGPSFAAPIPTATDGTPVWFRDHLLGFVRQIQTAVHKYSDTSGEVRRGDWAAWSVDGGWLGTRPSRGKALAAVFEAAREAIEQRRDPTRVLVDPPFRITSRDHRGELVKRQRESVGLVGQIEPGRELMPDEELSLLELYRQTGHLSPRILREAFFAACAVKKKFPGYDFEELFAIAAARMPDILAAFDPARYRLSTFATKPCQWAIMDHLRWRRRIEIREVPQEVLTRVGKDDGGEYEVEPLAELEWRADEFDSDWTGESAARWLVAALDDREREVLELRHGDGPMTLAQTAAKMGISPTRVRQLEKRALAKLRAAAPMPPEVADRQAADDAMLRSVLRTRAKFAPLGAGAA
jgi:RNA polymerase sigma factor (sigma-70 family)